MNYKGYIPYCMLCFLLIFVSCSNHPTLPETFSETDNQPTIYPDYTDVTIPCNIAPLNFMVENADECIAQFCWNNEVHT